MAKSKKIVQAEPVEEEEQVVLEVVSSSDSELLDSEEEQEQEVQGLEEETKGHTVNKVIIGKDAKKKKEGAKKGVIYIGRIPHGFHEQQMKTYFSQFGDIVNLCVARNKQGNLKHFGFIEFADYETAKVAQETMNNYLLAGHQLKVDMVDTSEKDVFKNPRKYKAVPWRQINQKKHDAKRTPDKVVKLETKFADKKKKRLDELKAKGINWEL